MLIELGTEELPPKSLKKLADSFSHTFFRGLVEAGVVPNKPENMQYFATPRRLSVWLKGVLPKQVEQIEHRKGPSLSVAFNHAGEAMPAATGFARSCGVEVEKLKTIKTKQGSWLFFESKKKSVKLSDLVSQNLNLAIKMLPVSKRMRWGDKEVEFVRPVHWLLALYGSDVVKIEVLGLKSDRYSFGHRVHSQGMLRIASADRYLETLQKKGFVIADYVTRRALIEKQLGRIYKSKDASVVIDSTLLDEVTGLVEWPVAMLGEFDQRFLKLPKEVLISTMQNHQKYFYIANTKGKLQPTFAFVSNIKSRTPKRVRLGNERVLRARLSDAEFFWQTDLQQTLDQKVETLKGILFHKKLGSIYDKTQRIGQLSLWVSERIDADPDKVRRTAYLCKSDLVTDMVNELPELQGTMGRYYAQKQNEDKVVANAIEDHYLPRFSGDKIAKSNIAKTLAIADKVDSLVGLFSCGEIPTGDRDPFGLRRAALGILRTIIEGKLPLDLATLVRESYVIYHNAGVLDATHKTQNCNQVMTFINERIKGYLQSRGLDQQLVSAVLICQSTAPLDIYNRATALSWFFKKNKEAAGSLVEANKRIVNLLSKVKSQQLEKGKFNKHQLIEPAEKQLTSALSSVNAMAKKHFSMGDYDVGLVALANLKEPIDQFFEQVMVMHDDPKIKLNRLLLLASVRQLFLDVADISQVKING